MCYNRSIQKELKMKVFTNEMIAKEYGEKYANTIFQDMLNVNNQGEDFKWENLPMMFREICGASLFMTYKKVPENFNELKELAKKCYTQEVRRLIKESENNQKLPVKS